MTGVQTCALPIFPSLLDITYCPVISSYIHCVIYNVFLSYYNIWCNVMLSDIILSFHVKLYQILLFYIEFCHIISYHTKRYHIILLFAISSLLIILESTQLFSPFHLYHFPHTYPNLSRCSFILIVSNSFFPLCVCISFFHFRWMKIWKERTYRIP